MSKAIFKFNSVTYAIKAKNVAERFGAKTKMQKNPNPKKGEGCGYSLIVFGDVENIKDAFENSKIKFTGFERAK